MRTLLRSYRFLRDPIQFLTDNMNLYGGTYSAKLPSLPNIILTRDATFISYVLKDNHTNYHKSPLTIDRVVEFLGKGMLFTNGEEWLKQRRLIQPGFHKEKIQGLYSIIIQAIDEYLVTMPTGVNVDMYPVLHQLAFNAVVRSLFDMQLSAETMHTLTTNFNDIQSFIFKDVNQPFRRPFYPVTGSEREMFKKSAEIKSIFKRLIQERRQSGESKNDLLDMLLHSKYEDTGLPMTEEQVVDELLVFITAGHETTANTLSWMMYLLSVNPGVLNKLTALVGESDILDAPKNEYINAVINESMRLYPPAWITDRVALQDDSFGGYSYPKGTIVISFFYGAHRDGAHWEKADDFVPGRFIDENGKLKKYKNYFPFGAGPRMCIGNNFAMAEMSFFLHAFFSRFTIRASGRPPKLKPLLTLRPDKVMLDIKALV